uniref:Odorant-binding protein 1 n=1 Tax=Phyllotreta striolata TaxID=444603 RepID=A0A1B1FKH8_PHYSR|nr:odorant-binding protein 1 [Phyllotreta striolata]
MKYIFLFLCLCVCVQHGLSVMSEKQLAATKKLIRNTCTNKAGVAPEKVDNTYKGIFDFDDKPAMCYAHCVMMTYKLMKKDNTFDWEEGLKVLEANAPPSLLKSATGAFKHCKNAAKSLDNKCKAALEISKCLYDFDPANYFLP